jgi:hypothetical protein
MGDNITKIKRTSQSIDNLSFDEGLLVKIVELIGADGVLKNPSTSEKQDDIIDAIENIPAITGYATEDTLETLIDPLAKYKDAGIDIESNPMYFGNIALDGSWYIECLDTESGSTYCKGATDYSTNWTNRESLTYGNYNTIFSA